MMLFSSSGDAEIYLEGIQGRKHFKLPNKRIPVYHVAPKQHLEAIKGVVIIALKRGKSLDHQGLTIEVLGLMSQSLFANLDTTFLHVTRTLEPAGTLADGMTIPFQFLDVDKSYESYYGENIRVKYFLRVTIEKNLSSSIVKEVEFFVVRKMKDPAVNCYVKIECGYEDAVQTELELAQLKYHNEGVLLGRLYFHIIRVRLVEILAKIVRKETIGSGKDAKVFESVIGEFEILDGPVAKGDSLPIRIFLKSCKVTPTYANISNRGSVRYFLSICLKDEEERTFSKEQEIIIWRSDREVVREGIATYKSK